MATTFRGFPACRCLKKFLPVLERELQETNNLVGELRIFQLIGDAAVSGNTHLGGGAYDITDGEDSQNDVWIARNMGSAEFARGLPEFKTKHRHGILRGCPHNKVGGYQIIALDAGFNGLGANGFGARDTGPRGYTVRTWQEGIRWAKARQKMRRRRARIKELRRQRAVINATIQRLLGKKD